jgi:hypothetical protein
VANNGLIFISCLPLPASGQQLRSFFLDTGSLRHDAHRRQFDTGGLLGPRPFAVEEQTADAATVTGNAVSPTVHLSIAVAGSLTRCCSPYSPAPRPVTGLVTTRPPLQAESENRTAFVRALLFVLVHE